jgi:hypothetical protein
MQSLSVYLEDPKYILDGLLNKSSWMFSDSCFLRLKYY